MAYLIRLKNRIGRYLTMFRVGRVLAIRQIQHSSIWTTLLIILIMFLTFLNLVVVSGILVGLIEGSLQANAREYTGNVLISTLPDESSIDNTQTILKTIENLPTVESYSDRYLTGATIEANYQTRRDFNTLPNSFSTTLAGMHPEKEDAVTSLSSNLVEGEGLTSDESGYVLLGALMVDRYSNFSDIFEPLKNIYSGETRVKITANGNTQEFIVKGILQSKVDVIEQRIFMTESDYRRLTGITTLTAEEIAIKGTGALADDELKNILLTYDFDRYAKVQTAREAIPKFLDDIKATFGLLGTVIGSIGIVVASITIFIVVYINAVTRRKSIGILKGIGIQGGAIQMAYTLQALFYALVGSILAMLVIYFFLVPFIDAHPINFPFSDGILVATPQGTAIRFIVLMLVTYIAGFLPAWLIVRQNTLDSILGR